MVATDRYKYIWNDGDLEELYDLKSDPYEMKNLINSPHHEDILKDMRERLARWQRKSGDDPMSPESYYQKMKNQPHGRSASTEAVS